MANEREKIRRPNSNVQRGHLIGKLREEGRELVDEDRLTTMFMDMDADFDYLPDGEMDDETARKLAKRALEILRG